MNQELQKLIEQKKEIELKIKELTNNITKSGRMLIGVEHYPTDKPDRWYLAVQCKTTVRKTHSLAMESKSVSRTIFNADTKEEVVKEIPAIIKELQELYEKAIS